MNNKPPRVCEICGAIEPPMWFEEDMNETIREYARAYIGPPKKFYPSLTAALGAWGIVIEPESIGEENDS